MAMPAELHVSTNIVQSYLGPERKIEKPRQSPERYSVNDAGGYVPTILFDMTIRDPLNKKVEQIMQKPEVTLALLQDLKEDIANHCEYRIQVFFQQMLLVYKTTLEFQFHNAADLQYGKFINKGQKEQAGDYAGAHSSTLPSLRLINSNGANPIAFADKSYFHKTWNATVFLPRKVNCIDSAWDKNTVCLEEEQSFRWHSTEILNQLAANAFDPQRGLKIFLKTARRFLSTIESLNKEEEELFVIKTYRSVVKAYKKQINEEVFIKSLCFAPTSKDSLEESYMRVQAGMHKKLIEDMNLLRPQPLELKCKKIMTRRIEKLGPIISAVLDQGFKAGAFIESTKAGVYVITCLTIIEVRDRTLYYLSKTKEKELLEDLEQVMVKASIPERMEEVFSTISDTIKREFDVKRPKNMTTIIVKILKQISENPVIDV